MNITNVIDTHVHLTTEKLENVLINNPPDSWKEGVAKRQVYAYNYFKEKVSNSSCQLAGCIYVQCFNAPPLEECCWAIEFAKADDNIIKGVIAEIPVPDGSEAVRTYLNQVRERFNGNLPSELKGGRVVLLGEDKEASLTDMYINGLKTLSEANLLWEFCSHPKHIPSILETCKKCPTKMTFVFDHLLHNAEETGGNDFETWSVNIAKLASEVPNSYCKLGAVEEWGCDDPFKYLEFTIDIFGYDRVLYESNWFVSEIFNCEYDDTAKLLVKVLKTKNASEEEIQKVFQMNAKKVYNLQ